MCSRVDHVNGSPLPLKNMPFPHPHFGLYPQVERAFDMPHSNFF